MSRFIHFHDNKGRTIRLPGKMTIRDLVGIGIGIRDIRLAVPTDPLPDNWFRAIEPESSPSVKSVQSVSGI